MATAQDICEAITPMLKLLANHPESMRVDMVPEDGGFVMRVQVTHQDAGRLIGMQGRTARSLRVLLGAIAVQNGLKAKLNIVEG
jgi:predicted RNA-binding protein YlqC (UPF0109 family)